jgi:NAD(P)H-dependent flavin oxidoreductase YrpB (nitropropane dioxygenase family)
VNPIQPEYVPNTSYAREYAVSIVANLTKESIKNPDFWSRSATDVLTACIWYLREEHPEICDIPHVLAMVGSNGTALLNTLQKNIITEQMVRSVYDALQRGADKISINSSAINTPRLISDAADKFGSQCVVVAIDARRRADGSGWNVYKNGGRIDTGLDAIEWAVKANELGAGEILLTSMDCDGTKDGYDIELTRLIADNVSVPVIASGGAGTKEHFYEALTEGKADAALAASLFHYKELEIMDLKNYLADKGVSVRR